MKKICFSIPCYNEVDNIEELTHGILEVMSSYEYQVSIEYIDNYSTDGTREKLYKLCEEYPNNVKAIFNARNFGGVSNYYGMLQTDGDCTIVLPCDFQVPLSIIGQLIDAWENGARIVCAVKQADAASGLLKKFRNTYYYLVKSSSDINQIEHYTGAGLYDREFIEWLRKVNDPIPSLRSLAVEYGCSLEQVKYNEQERKSGKSKQNFNSLFNVATRNLINYTELIPNLFMLSGTAIAMGCVIGEIVCLILKLVFWSSFNNILIPIILIVIMVCGIAIAGMGVLAKYLSVINKRLMNRPLVVEEKRLNFDEETTNS